MVGTSTAANKRRRVFKIYSQEDIRAERASGRNLRVGLNVENYDPFIGIPRELEEASMSMGFLTVAEMSMSLGLTVAEMSMSMGTLPPPSSTITPIEEEELAVDNLMVMLNPTTKPSMPQSSRPITVEELVAENLMLNEITFPTPKPSIFLSVADVELGDSSNDASTPISMGEEEETTQNNGNIVILEEGSNTADEYYEDGYTDNTYRVRSKASKSGKSE